MNKRKEIYYSFDSKEEGLAQQPPNKKNKISEGYLEYKKYCESGNTINFADHRIVIYDIVLTTNDNVNFHFIRDKLNESRSKKFNELSVIHKNETIVRKYVAEHSSNFNQLLNWICRPDIDTRKIWLAKNYDVKDNFHNIIQLIKSSITWECIDLFDECWDLMQKQPLPWPIRAIESIIENSTIRPLSNTNHIAKAWMKKVNEMKVCDIGIKTIIIGDFPSANFWDVCISLGVNSVVDDVKIRIAVPLLAILPNVPSIPSDYRKSLIERLDIEVKSHKDVIVNILSMMPSYGASADLLKYIAITSYIDRPTPLIEDKKMSKLEKFCNTLINVNNGGWFRALYDVNKLIKREKRVSLWFTDGIRDINITVEEIDVNNFARIWNEKYDRHDYGMTESEWNGVHLMSTPSGTLPRFTSIETRAKMWNKGCVKCKGVVYMSSIYYTKQRHSNELCEYCHRKGKK
jgi:hypothetical protein